MPAGADERCTTGIPTLLEIWTLMVFKTPGRDRLSSLRIKHFLISAETLSRYTEPECDRSPWLLDISSQIHQRVAVLRATLPGMHNQ